MWHTCESSNVERFRYDSQCLTVEFKRRAGVATYMYFDVPLDIYTGLLEAESKGKYLHKYVIGYYQYRRLYAT